MFFHCTKKTIYFQGFLLGKKSKGYTQAYIKETVNMDDEKCLNKLQSI